MAQPLTVTLSVLTGLLYLTGLSAAEQASPQACDANGVCTTTATPPAAPTGGKQMWASSFAFTDAPPLEVQKWLSEKPEMKGKFLVIEFWRTWCGACKRMTPLMNTLQKKYGDELVVIGITGEPEEKVMAYKGPKKEYCLALDRPQAETSKEKPASKGAAGAAADGPDQAEGTIPTTAGQGAYEAYFGVWGWPHVIILEPQHHTIIWEGFPGLKGYELTEAKVAKILAIGRAAGEAKTEKR
jgi:thiol-disulfide isomerase/thioredoxin